MNRQPLSNLKRDIHENAKRLSLRSTIKSQLLNGEKSAIEKHLMIQAQAHADKQGHRNKDLNRAMDYIEFFGQYETDPQNGWHLLTQLVKDQKNLPLAIDRLLVHSAKNLAADANRHWCSI